ncbi:MAG: hypothetical protein IPM54_25560 [Polyangiaceae bacterium]|nr:hypothetical protein [Polyangiaceae bacterium]
MKKIFALMGLLALGGCVVDTAREPEERIGEAAQAVSSTVTASCSIANKVMHIETGAVPQGWGKPTTDKSPFELRWYASVTNCIPTAATDSIISTETGEFTTVQKPNGYYWTADYDFTQLDYIVEHHWHNKIMCDGSTVVVGCDEARTISYTLSVGGACLQTQGATCTYYGTVDLPAVQDADEYETNCAVDCEAGIGQCVSACQHCDSTVSDCVPKACCVCSCKEQTYGHGHVCGPQPMCYTGTPGHQACF